MSLKATVLLASAMIALPHVAYADNTACSGAIFVVPDGSLHTGSFTAAGQLRWFRFATRPDRSYAISIENLSPTDVQPFVEFSEDNTRLGTCSGPEASTLFMESADAASRAVGGVIGSARATFVAEKATDFFFAVSTGKLGQTFRVRVDDTTLFSPFFTTQNSQETYYRFANTTSAGLIVTLKLVNDAGAAVATHTFKLAANSTSPVIYTGPAAAPLVGLNIANNLLGQAVITHNGPPGALAADGFWGLLSKGAAAIAVPIVVTAARPPR
jgi:hypothetical protein